LAKTRKASSISYAREQVDVLSEVLSDGFTTASQFLQQHDVLVAKRGGLLLDEVAARARLLALQSRIGAEETRVSRLRGAVMAAPIEGVLWEVLVGDSEVVQSGQEVLKLMNYDSALVTLSVPDVVYNRLTVGQTARFRLNGSGEYYDGTITRIAGSGAETIYRNLAMAPNMKHLERNDVALLVPALRANLANRCSVGQTGRMFFETRTLDLLRELWG
jgi:multidrug resistance efflux pump